MVKKTYMKSLVVYDSNFGNTKKIAEAVAQTVEGKAVKVSGFKNEMLKGITLLIVGSPINGWRPSEQISAFLVSLPHGCLEGIHVASFDTRIKIFFSGDAASKINKILVNLGGKPVPSTSLHN